MAGAVWGVEAVSDPLRISDHALIRYIERIKGVSLDQYRQEILSLTGGRDQVNVKELPDGYDDGALFIVEMNEVIITVIGRGQRPKRTKRFGARFIHVPQDAIP